MQPGRLWWLLGSLLPRLHRGAVSPFSDQPRPGLMDRRPRGIVKPGRVLSAAGPRLYSEVARDRLAVLPLRLGLPPLARLSPPLIANPADSSTRSPSNPGATPSGSGGFAIC